MVKEAWTLNYCGMCVEYRQVEGVFEVLDHFGQLWPNAEDEMTDRSHVHNEVQEGL